MEHESEVGGMFFGEIPFMESCEFEKCLQRMRRAPGVDVSRVMEENEKLTLWLKEAERKSETCICTGLERDAI